MFGALRPDLCRLGAERAVYRRVYCGTCSALGTRYGQLARPLLSYDAVLLATVAEALLTTPSSPDSCRCPAAGYLVYRPTLAPDSAPMRLAAATQLALADQWLADQALDGRRSLAALRVWSRRRAARARVELAELGVEVDGLDRLAERQKALEAAPALEVEAAAEPTARVLRSIFGQLGALPGMGAELTAEPVPGTLGRLGGALGQAIYLVDALEDLPRDARRGEFNPCLGGDGRVVPSRLSRATELLERALGEVADAVAALPLRRHRAIVENVLCQRLPARARAAGAAARRAASEEVGARPPWRIVAPLLALFALFAAVFARVGARARRVVRRRAVAHACAPSPGLALAMSTGGSGDDDGLIDLGDLAPGGGGGPLSPEALEQLRRDEEERQKRSGDSGEAAIESTQGCCDCCDCCECCRCCDGCGSCGDGKCCGSCECSCCECGGCECGSCECGGCD